MQKVKFNNITISSDSDDYVLQSFNPNDVEVSRQTVQFYNQDGETVLNSNYNTRYVKLKGCIIADTLEEMYSKRAALCRAFDGITQSEIEYIISEGESEKAYYVSQNVIAETPSFADPEGTTIEFSMNFILPNFYWQTKTPVEQTDSGGEQEYTYENVSGV